MQSKLPRGFKSLAKDLGKAEAAQERAERFQSKPLIEIDLGKKTVKLSVGAGPRLELGGDDAAGASGKGGSAVAGNGAGGTGANASTGSANAASATGGPNAASASASGGKPAPPPVPSRSNRPALSQPNTTGGSGISSVARPDVGS